MPCPVARLSLLPSRFRLPVAPRLPSLAFSTASSAVPSSAYAYPALSTNKYSCSGEPGGACSCSSTELNSCRSPAKPAALFPRRVTIGAAGGKGAFLCTCGASKNYPFCDGSHNAMNKREGTSFKPLHVAPEGASERTISVCACGHSKKRPLCDGAHKRLQVIGTTESSATAAHR
jgi:CDGSH-type Zn-finger protein